MSIFMILKALIASVMVLGGIMLARTSDTGDLGLWVGGFLIGMGVMKLASMVLLVGQKAGEHKKRSKSKGGQMEFGFTVDTLEGGQDSLQRYGKLLDRALQIRLFKKELSDTECFHQAVTEAVKMGDYNNDED
jgi:hypothetical protein